MITSPILASAASSSAGSPPPITEELPGFAMLGVFLFACLLFELRFFARGRDATVREAILWSIGWIALAIAAAAPLLLLRDGGDAVTYLTVYTIERTLSLDNLFVFLLLFAFFAVPHELRPRLLVFGIVGALLLRGLAIIGGVTLINEFHFVIYILAVLLLLLAWRMFTGMGESEPDPNKNPLVKVVRRLYPVTDGFRGSRWSIKEGGKRYVTPLLLCLVAMIGADLAFAVDSIPAAFGITDDPLLIWMGNVFALLGMRSLFVLVEWLVARFRYMDETIAIMLGLIGVKLLIEDFVHIGPLASLGMVLVAFTAGILLSIAADKRDPRPVDEAKRL